MYNYIIYRPEELAADPSFRNWKLKGLEEDTHFWNEWVSLHPEKQSDIDKATLLLEAVFETFDQISEADARYEVRQIAAQLSESQMTQDSSHRLVSFSNNLYKLAAVVLLLLLSAGAFLTWKNGQLKPTHADYMAHTEAFEGLLTEIVNTTTTDTTLLFSDSSRVILRAGSRISFQALFSGTNREVFLEGEAEFEVQKNPEKPFLVYSGDLITRVLGTRFRVKQSADGGEIEVEVKTGQVSVSRQGAGSEEGKKYPREIILKPNQQVVYRIKENQFLRGLSETPQPLPEANLQGLMNFKGLPIALVFERLQQAYGIEILYDKDLMKNCFLTASFTDEPLLEKMDLITRTIDATFAEVDGQLVVNSRGCP
ncbi:FecR family protein [Arundinibacter roseus]|uniref:FecR family protein n=1 Tax=Arundinibacter roseus TaxID=2070510 RepID=A0A4R4K8W1_9BACT|nr:FecR family protein [Arundinibacter roseus]TDB64184.1 FecR family protein [Arundinibacter roseus]